MARKKKRLRYIKGNPPTPFYVDGPALYHWPSTYATDRVWKFLRRLFGPTRKDTSKD